MPPQERLLWTTTRRLWGNLLPLIVVGPGLALSLNEVVSKGLTPFFWGWIAATSIGGWFFVNWFGLTGNKAMKEALTAQFDEDHPHDRREKWFVGFARPSFKSYLDPHEDVGFLVLDSSRMIFMGEARRVELHRDQVTGIGFRANIHSWLGLGRWVTVEAVLDGKPGRLMIEPREKATLIANRRLGADIHRALIDWSQTPKGDPVRRLSKTQPLPKPRRDLAAAADPLKEMEQKADQAKDRKPPQP
jgi:hypothetical protein